MRAPLYVVGALLLCAFDGGAQKSPRAACRQFPAPKDTIETIIRANVRPAEFGKKMDTTAARLLLEAIAPNIELPSALALPVFGSMDRSRKKKRIEYAYPNFSGTILFRLDSTGRLNFFQVGRSSMTPGLEALMMNAISKADSVRAFTPVAQRVQNVDLEFFLSADDTLPSTGLELGRTRTGAYRMTKPVVLDPSSGAPRYPETLRQSRIQGTVVVSFVVSDAGVMVPGSARVEKATHPDFVAPSLRFLSGARFWASEAGECNVHTLVSQEFQFRLY